MRIKNITLHNFGSYRGNNQFHFEVNRSGKRVVVIGGKNGAGKTTTLKSVVGILQFDAGEITIDGISIKEQPLVCKKKFAYIPDNPDLYDFMTGIKYLNFIADVFGVDENTRQERIRKYADLFEITNDL